MLTIGYIKDTYPHSFEAIIAISNERPQNLNDGKELEDDFLNEETFIEIEKILEEIYSLTEEEIAEQFKLKLNLKEKQILENEGTMIEVVFLRDENINKISKKYPIIEEFYDSVEGLDLLDDLIE